MKKTDTTSKDWWKEIDLTTLDSIEMCNETLLHFDDVVDSMGAQISGAQLNAQQGRSEVDEVWYRSTLLAYNHAKKKRKELNLRRDTMLKAANAKYGKEKQDLMDRIAVHLETIASILVKIENKL